MGLLCVSILSSCTAHETLLSVYGHPIDTKDESIVSWQQIKELNVVMQDEEYSCGAASLATLMSYYFGDSVSEKDLLDDIKSNFSSDQQSKIEANGLSFAELAVLADSRGYQSASVELDWSALVQIKGPILVFIEPEGYPHFAILRGFIDNRAFLADPSRGNIRMPTTQFEQEWSGKAFVLGKEGFGTPTDYPLAIRSGSEFRSEVRTARETPND